MALDAQFALLAAIVLLAVTTEAATGFGSMVIGVTLGLHLYPIHSLLPILVLLNLVLTSYIVCRYRGRIARRLLLLRILPLMAVGLVVGLVVFYQVSGDVLKTLFGFFVVAVAARELRTFASTSGTSARRLSRSAETSGMLAAGVVHGVFASGGPLLVYVLGRSDLDKGSFRSTLATVFLTLNSTLTGIYALTGKIGGATLSCVGALVPVVLLAIVIGELIHHRLDERRFRVVVFSLLLVAGVSILL